MSHSTISDAQAQAIFRQYPRLETRRLLLRKISFDDQDAISAYASDPEVTRYTLFDYHRTIAETRAFIDRTVKSYRRREPGVWGIVQKDDGKLIGSCGVHYWERNHARAEIGYVIRRDSWNCGFATEAIATLLAFGFSVMQLNRIEAKCVPANLASRRVLEKLGMTCEGTLRQHQFFKSAYQDLAIYSLLRREYKPAALL